MSSSSQTTQGTTSSTTTPGFAPQASALTTAMNGAQDAYGKSSQATAPTDFTAQFTPDQLATFKSMLGYANGNTAPQTTSATGATLQNAGAGATTGALSGLASYDPTTQNNTGSLVDAANQYVAGQNIPAQVAQATQQARENARDVVMPGIEQNAAITGNTNSSRTGIAQGMVERGLAENAQNLGGALSSTAFSHGLDLASTNANANNVDKLGALSNTANAGTNAANSGVNASSSGINDATGLYNIANAGGTGEQAANQANLTNQLQQYQSGVSSPYDSLKQLMSIIGTNNWGQTTNGTSNSTTTKTPSIMSDIGQGLGIFGQGVKMLP